MKKICIMITAALLLLAVPAAAQVDVSQSGRVVTVSGTLTEKTENQKITVTVKDSAGELVYLGQTTCDSGGAYSDLFSLTEDKTQSLRITVKAANENLTEETASFTYQKTESGGGGGGAGSGTGGNTVVKVPADYIPAGPTTVPTSYEEPTWLSALSGHWAYGDIASLVKQDILAEDEAVSPDAVVTRIDFVEMICRATGRKAESYDGLFADVDASFPQALYLQAAVDDGIISKDTLFRPNDPVSRQEMCKVLCTAGGKTEDVKPETRFTDEASFGAWAVSYVYRAAAAGWINGMPDGSFVPFASVTYGQAAAVTNRMLAA